ncbi:hypothetical protein [Streptomyces rimosus]|uniref:hypothetical protein n=1 Tax=Streptomyces rimosus TaxID=1927 RepID=UPI0004C053FA|nr:hypothetical protein [Streptomyces rimosus]
MNEPLHSVGPTGASLREHLTGWAERQPSSPGIAAGVDVPADGGGEPAVVIEQSEDDGARELAAQVDKLHRFLQERGTERVATPLFWESLGYARGRAEAHLAHGDTARAAQMLRWFQNEAEAQGKDHPDFPAEGAR